MVDKLLNNRGVWLGLVVLVWLHHVILGAKSLSGHDLQTSFRVAAPAHQFHTDITKKATEDLNQYDAVSFTSSKISPTTAPSTDDPGFIPKMPAELEEDILVKLLDKQQIQRLLSNRIGEKGHGSFVVDWTRLSPISPLNSVHIAGVSPSTAEALRRLYKERRTGHSEVGASSGQRRKREAGQVEAEIIQVKRTGNSSDVTLDFFLQQDGNLVAMETAMQKLQQLSVKEMSALLATPVISNVELVTKSRSVSSSDPMTSRYDDSTDVESDSALRRVARSAPAAPPNETESLPASSPTPSIEPTKVEPSSPSVSFQSVTGIHSASSNLVSGNDNLPLSNSPGLSSLASLDSSSAQQTQSSIVPESISSQQLFGSADVSNLLDTSVSLSIQHTEEGLSSMQSVTILVGSFSSTFDDLESAASELFSTQSLPNSASERIDSLDEKSSNFQSVTSSLHTPKVSDMFTSNTMSTSWRGLSLETAPVAKSVPSIGDLMTSVQSQDASADNTQHLTFLQSMKTIWEDSNAMSANDFSSEFVEPTGVLDGSSSSVNMLFSTTASGHLKSSFNPITISKESLSSDLIRSESGSMSLLETMKSVLSTISYISDSYLSQYVDSSSFPDASGQATPFFSSVSPQPADSSATVNFSVSEESISLNLFTSSPVTGMESPSSAITSTDSQFPSANFQSTLLTHIISISSDSLFERSEIPSASSGLVGESSDLLDLSSDLLTMASSSNIDASMSSSVAQSSLLTSVHSTPLLSAYGSNSVISEAQPVVPSSGMTFSFEAPFSTMTAIAESPSDSLNSFSLAFSSKTLLIDPSVNFVTTRASFTSSAQSQFVVSMAPSQTIDSFASQLSHAFSPSQSINPVTSPQITASLTPSQAVSSLVIPKSVSSFASHQFDIDKSFSTLGVGMSSKLASSDETLKTPMLSDTNQLLFTISPHMSSPIYTVNPTLPTVTLPQSESSVFVVSPSAFFSEQASGSFLASTLSSSVVISSSGTITSLDSISQFQSLTSSPPPSVTVSKMETLNLTTLTVTAESVSPTWSFSSMSSIPHSAHSSLQASFSSVLPQLSASASSFYSSSPAAFFTTTGLILDSVSLSISQLNSFSFVTSAHDFQTPILKPSDVMSGTVLSSAFSSVYSGANASMFPSRSTLSMDTSLHTSLVASSLDILPNFTSSSVSQSSDVVASFSSDIYANFSQISSTADSSPWTPVSPISTGSVVMQSSQERPTLSPDLSLTISDMSGSIQAVSPTSVPTVGSISTSYPGFTFDHTMVSQDLLSSPSSVFSNLIPESSRLISVNMSESLSVPQHTTMQVSQVSTVGLSPSQIKTSPIFSFSATSLTTSHLYPSSVHLSENPIFSTQTTLQGSPVWTAKTSVDTTSVSPTPDFPVTATVSSLTPSLPDSVIFHPSPSSSLNSTIPSSGLAMKTASTHPSIVPSPTSSSLPVQSTSRLPGFTGLTSFLRIRIRVAPTVDITTTAFLQRMKAALERLYRAAMAAVTRTTAGSSQSARRLRRQADNVQAQLLGASRSAEAADEVLLDFQIGEGDQPVDTDSALATLKALTNTQMTGIITYPVLNLTKGFVTNNTITVIDPTNTDLTVITTGNIVIATTRSSISSTAFPSFSFTSSIPSSLSFTSSITSSLLTPSPSVSPSFSGTSTLATTSPSFSVTDSRDSSLSPVPTAPFSSWTSTSSAGLPSSMLTSTFGSSGSSFQPSASASSFEPSLSVSTRPSISPSPSSLSTAFTATPVSSLSPSSSFSSLSGPTETLRPDSTTSGSVEPSFTLEPSGSLTLQPTITTAGPSTTGVVTSESSLVSSISPTKTVVDPTSTDAASSSLTSPSTPSQSPSGITSPTTGIVPSISSTLLSTDMFPSSSASITSTGDMPSETLTPSLPDTTVATSVFTSTALPPTVSPTPPTSSVTPSSSVTPGPDPFRDALLRVDLELKVEFDEQSALFKDSFERGIVRAYLEALQARRKRHATPTDVIVNLRHSERYIRQAGHQVDAEMTSAVRNSSDPKVTNVTFYVTEDGALVPARDASITLNKLTPNALSAILAYPVVSTVRPVHGQLIAAEPYDDEDLGLLFVVAIVMPCLLVLMLAVVLLGFLVRSCRETPPSAETADVMPTKYQRGESLDDYNLHVDVERGEIVDRSPKHTPGSAAKVLSSANGHGTKLPVSAFRPHGDNDDSLDSKNHRIKEWLRGDHKHRQRVSSFESVESLAKSDTFLYAQLKEKEKKKKQAKHLEVPVESYKNDFLQALKIRESALVERGGVDSRGEGSGEKRESIAMEERSFDEDTGKTPAAPPVAERDPPHPKPRSFVGKLRESIRKRKRSATPDDYNTQSTVVSALGDSSHNLTDKAASREGSRERELRSRGRWHDDETRAQHTDASDEFTMIVPVSRSPHGSRERLGSSGSSFLALEETAIHGPLDGGRARKARLGFHEDDANSPQGDGSHDRGRVDGLKVLKSRKVQTVQESSLDRHNEDANFAVESGQARKASQVTDEGRQRTMQTQTSPKDDAKEAKVKSVAVGPNGVNRKTQTPVPRERGKATRRHLPALKLESVHTRSHPLLSSSSSSGPFGSSTSMEQEDQLEEEFPPEKVEPFAKMSQISLQPAEREAAIPVRLRKNLFEEGPQAPAESTDLLRFHKPAHHMRAQPRMPFMMDPEERRQAELVDTAVARQQLLLRQQQEALAYARRQAVERQAQQLVNESLNVGTTSTTPVGRQLRPTPQADRQKLAALLNEACVLAPQSSYVQQQPAPLTFQGYYSPVTVLSSANPYPVTAPISVSAGPHPGAPGGLPVMDQEELMSAVRKELKRMQQE